MLRAPHSLDNQRRAVCKEPKVSTARSRYTRLDGRALAAGARVLPFDRSATFVLVGIRRDSFSNARAGVPGALFRSCSLATTSLSYVRLRFGRLGLQYPLACNSALCVPLPPCMQRVFLSLLVTYRYRGGRRGSIVSERHRLSCKLCSFFVVLHAVRASAPTTSQSRVNHL